MPSQAALNSLNVPQGKDENKSSLIAMGGVDGMMKNMSINKEVGLTTDQLNNHKRLYGSNEMPKSPMTGFFTLLIRALNDPTQLILIAAASVSLGVGIYEDPEKGYIEGAAIFIAVILVSNLTAFNDYSKELQFRALEATSAQDQRQSVLRNGIVERINPADLVVGDIIVLQSGDMIPADSIIIDNSIVLANESALTGEPDDLEKTKTGDCFLLSSCLITDGDNAHAVVVGTGLNSQWGKIKSNLITESVDTPLQEKLGVMTKQVCLFVPLTFFCFDSKYNCCF
jgi:Ca2+-transporting ATPase